MRQVEAEREIPQSAALDLIAFHTFLPPIHTTHLTMNFTIHFLLDMDGLQLQLCEMFTHPIPHIPIEETATECSAVHFHVGARE